ncbi:MAG: hypothetical protein AMXMBFR84_20940 [Candidatus Hydrogenedentota bacterium]
MSNRIIAVAIVALALGASGGAVGVYAKYNAYIADLETQMEASQKAQKTLQAQSDELKKQLAQLEAQRKILETQAAALATPQPQGPAESAAMDQTDAPSTEGGRLAEMLAGQAALLEIGRQRDEREERDERREQGREEFRARMQEGVSNYFQEALAATTDPVAQQHILNIQQQVNANMEMMQNMRNLETDEEREAAREQGRAAWEQTRNLVREYQDHMLGSSLASSGITDPGQQQQILSNLRSTMESEYYNLSAGGFGRGGFGGGGPGGWGGRGGGFGGGRGGPPQQGGAQ